jgi:hypothetical protein
MKLKLLTFSTIICLAFQMNAMAQEDPEPKKGFDKDKLFFGGNFGLSFGDYTLINVSPQIGYRFNKWFAAGAGPNFIYSSIRYRYFYSYDDYRNNYGVAGLNVFGRIYPIDYVFLQLQPEANYTWGKIKFYDGTPDAKLPGKIVPSLLGGVGGAIPTGGRGALIILIQYDLLQNNRSPYGTRAFYGLGYNIGI